MSSPQCFNKLIEEHGWQGHLLGPTVIYSMPCAPLSIFDFDILPILFGAAIVAWVGGETRLLHTDSSSVVAWRQFLQHTPQRFLGRPSDSAS